MIKYFFLAIFAFAIFACNSSTEDGNTSNSKEVREFVEVPQVLKPSFKHFPAIDYDHDQWVEIEQDENYSLDIRYATEENFMQKKIYDCGRCFLEPQTFIALEKAKEIFKQRNYRVILFDCYRPRPFQQKLWDIKPDARFVTPPSKGSMHTRGQAVDISLIDSLGQLVDMGTEYDFFGPEAYYLYPDSSPEVKANRKFLRETMVSSGFKGIRTEWWHFSLRANPVALSDWEWNCN